MQFVGIDLAWGEGNTSAAVVLEAGGASYETLHALEWHEALGSNEEIVAFVHSADGGGGLLIGMDAPLIVPNERGERPCETKLRRCFGRYEASPLPANRHICGGYLRGEELLQRLNTALGTTPDYRFLPLDTTVRRCLEVFPRSAQCALFHLKRSLKYKAKPGRSLQSRWAEYARYATLLESLKMAQPSLLPPSWLSDLQERRGRSLKRYEDLLDALLCAYIVAYYWHYGEGERCCVVGDSQNGYILTPVTPGLAACLQADQPTDR
jgi:predicted RNase H-like nuclease